MYSWRAGRAGACQPPYHDMGILLTGLTFGMALVNPSVVPNNLIYCVIVFLLLYFAEYNTFSLERLWRKKK